MILYLDSIPSPLGNLFAVTDEKSLCALYFEQREARYLEWIRVQYGDVDLRRERERLGVRERLERYFAGDFSAFDGMALDPKGSDFQKSVWTALLAIPAGTTTTYGAVAQQLGSAKLARAVGLANGSNPIPVIVPCHRVIGTNGKLTGYGGGLPRKTWLLRHEGVLLMGM